MSKRAKRLLERAEALRDVASHTPRERVPYPLPDYAAQVWFNGTGISISVPATMGESGHIVTVPATDAGLRTLLGILQERSRATQRSGRVIGLRSAPVQYDLDAMVQRINSALSSGKSGASGANVTKLPPQNESKEARLSRRLRELGLE